MYKKVILVITLAISFSGFSQLGPTVYVQEAYTGKVGGQFQVYEYKKGYMLSAQDIRYNYVSDPVLYKFKKKDHFLTFVNNIKVVYGWKDQLNLDEYPDGYNFHGGTYAIEWDPKFPNHVTVKFSNDLDGSWEGIIILNETRINNFYNEFFN